jgi:hypothetical protein
VSIRPKYRYDDLCGALSIHFLTRDGEVLARRTIDRSLVACSQFDRLTCRFSAWIASVSLHAAVTRTQTLGLGSFHSD